MRACSPMDVFAKQATGQKRRARILAPGTFVCESIKGSNLSSKPLIRDGVNVWRLRPEKARGRGSRERGVNGRERMQKTIALL